MLQTHLRLVAPCLVVVTVIAISSAPTRADLALELVGEPLLAHPYFEYIQVVQAGSPVTIAFDPSPNPFNATCNVYVVAAKSAAQWKADRTLIDVRPSGPEPHTFACTDNQTCRMPLRDGDLLNGNAGCLQPGIVPTCIGLGVPYDVVLDCDGDGILGGLDAVDGRGDQAGFWVVHDTTVPRLPVTLFNFDVVATNPSGNEYELPVCFGSAPCLSQDCFDERLAYPTNIAQIPGGLPLVVVSHGNGHCYTFYDYLLSHLASYGYVVMSHFNNTHPGVGGSDGTGGAAETTLKHTDAVIDLLTSPDCATRIPSHPEVCGRIDPSRIVWIGHSRGGGGVVWARTRLASSPSEPIHYTARNYSEASLRLISAMAPIDTGIVDRLAEPGAIPFHLIWGSGDQDVQGRPSTDTEAFGLLERADGPRQSVYFHGGAHGWFHGACTGPGTLDCTPAGPGTLGQSDVHAIATGYFVPLLKRYLEGNVPAQEFLWRPWQRFHPPGAPATAEVALEYRNAGQVGRFVIDDFETQASPTVSSSGGSVSQTLDPSGSDPGLYLEGLMDDTDCHFDWRREDGVPGSFFTNCAPNDVCPQGSPCRSGYGRPSDGTTPCQLTCAFTGEQPMNGMTRSKSGGESHGVAFSWTDPEVPHQVEFGVVAGEREFSDNEYLSFRAAQMPRNPLTRAVDEDLTFSVTLRDGAGVTSSVGLSSYEAGIIEPYARTGPIEAIDKHCCGNQLCVTPPGCNHTFSGVGWQTEFETVRIRVQDFKTGNPGFNLNDVRAVRFDFGSGLDPGAGRIALDDVEVGPAPPCPSVQPCLAPGCVTTNNVIDALDTGLTACVRPNGQVFKCSNGRVNVVTRSCSKGKCCKQQPACICLNGPCPNGTDLECRLVEVVP